MAHYFLIHGSWHDGSAWDGVVSVLAARGHEATAPTLAGHGPGVSRDVAFADYVESVVDAVRASGLKDLVLVGHSLGGAVVAAAAGLVAEQISRVVLVAPLLPVHGETLADILPPDSAAGFAALAAQSEDNSITLPWPVWRERFIGEADESTAKRSYDMLTPEPYRPVNDVIDMNGFDALPIGRSYIHCRSDVVFPPGEMHFFPRFFNRSGFARLIEIDAGHEAMFSMPEVLADALIKAARP
jgi:pimeloyl-ACP methyl ester carboxylesterase